MIESHKGGGVTISGPEDIQLYRLLTLDAAVEGAHAP
jgi:hypothetical protein